MILFINYNEKENVFVASILLENKNGIALMSLQR